MDAPKAVVTPEDLAEADGSGLQQRVNGADLRISRAMKAMFALPDQNERVRLVDNGVTSRAFSSLTLSASH